MTEQKKPIKRDGSATIRKAEQAIVKARFTKSYRDFKDAPTTQSLENMLNCGESYAIEFAEETTEDTVELQTAS